LDLRQLAAAQVLRQLPPEALPTSQLRQDTRSATVFSTASWIAAGDAFRSWMWSRTWSCISSTNPSHDALKLGRPGVCHLNVRVVDGRTAEVGFTGADISPTDPDSVYGRLVAECLHHRQMTPPPPDFALGAVVSGAPITIRAGASFR
jgi:hypothetical protein